MKSNVRAYGHMEKWRWEESEKRREEERRSKKGKTHKHESIAIYSVFQLISVSNQKPKIRHKATTTTTLQYMQQLHCATLLYYIALYKNALYNTPRHYTPLYKSICTTLHSISLRYTTPPTSTRRITSQLQIPLH